jgi:hypothetical protein
MSFENITKNVELTNNKSIVNLDHNAKDGNIGIVATCFVGFDVEGTIEDTGANAEFIAHCFILQQKLDIGCFEKLHDTLANLLKELSFCVLPESMDATIKQAELVLKQANKQ